MAGNVILVLPPQSPSLVPVCDELNVISLKSTSANVATVVAVIVLLVPIALDLKNTLLTAVLDAPNVSVPLMV